MDGLDVRVTPADGSPSFDALLVGGYGEYEDGDVDKAALVQIQRVDNLWDPVGEPEHVRIKALRIPHEHCSGRPDRAAARLPARHLRNGPGVILSCRASYLRCCDSAKRGCRLPLLSTSGNDWRSLLTDSVPAGC